MRNKDIIAEVIYFRDQAEEAAAMDRELNCGLAADYYDGQADAFDQMRTWLDSRKDPVEWVLDLLDAQAVRVLKLTDLYKDPKDKWLLDYHTGCWCGLRDAIHDIKSRIKAMEG